MQAVSSLVNMTQNARFLTYRFSPCGSSLVSISNAAARLCPSQHRGSPKKCQSIGHSRQCVGSMNSSWRGKARRHPLGVCRHGLTSTCTSPFSITLT